MSNANVFLWGTRIGTVSQDGNAPALFTYDREFLGSGIEVAPLTMPLATAAYSFPGLAPNTFYGLPGLLSDSLPDTFGNRVISQWLATQGRAPDSMNAVERLCYTGVRGMGALEFFPAVGPGQTKAEQISVDRLAVLAAEVLQSRNAVHLTDTNMTSILQVGSSAGGSRAKALIAWNEETGDVRSGQIKAEDGYGYWLIKFAVPRNGDHGLTDDPSYSRIEYAYSRMAQEAGINMSECRLWDGKHFMTRRFDRTEIGEKLHMQTLCGLTHYDFNTPAQYSYEQAAEVCARLELPQADRDQLCRRMIFNELAKNYDDHTKNISFLMDRSGAWQLSPAYDVTFAKNPYNFWLRAHQMTINGKCEGVTQSDLIACAARMNVSAAQCLLFIEETRNAIAHWYEYAEDADVPEEKADRIAEEIGADARAISIDEEER